MDPSPTPSAPDLRRSELRGAAVYVAAISVVAVGVGILLGVLGPRPIAFAAIYAFMLTPALASVAVRLARREGFADAGLRFGGIPGGGWRSGARWYAAAWGIGVGGTALVYLALWAIGEARVDLDWERVLALAPPGSGTQRPPAWLGERQFMVLAAVANLTVMLVPGMILGLGEELGWRGYLLPRLLGRSTGFQPVRWGGVEVWPAVILTGLIWAMWHIPLSLIVPARVPWWVGVPAGLIAAVCVGAVFAWLRARSRSVFVVALAHIAFNNANAAAVLIFDVPPVSFLVALVSLTVVMAGVLAVTGQMGRVAEISVERTAGSTGR